VAPFGAATFSDAPRLPRAAAERRADITLTAHPATFGGSHHARRLFSKSILKRQILPRKGV